MKRVPVSFCDVQSNAKNYNTQNLHEYDPYVWDEATNTLFVDCDWWNFVLTEFAKKTIQQRLAQLDTKPLLDHKSAVAVPHPTAYSKAELCMYRTYLDSHDFQEWYKMLRNADENTRLIQISAEEKRVFARLAAAHLKDALEITKESLQSISSFLEKVDGVLKGSEQEWFMRLSGTSGKNECPVEPVATVDQVVKRLVSNVLFLHQEFERFDKETWLILKPWNDKIEKRTEFRVFCCGGKITGVSQQHWQQLFCYSDEELAAVEKAITNAAFLNNAPYFNYVADVWVSFADAQCHLIEFNPFGAHCGAGSSLFEWISDFDKLYGNVKDNAVELRFTSLLLY